MLFGYKCFEPSAVIIMNEGLIKGKANYIYLPCAPEKQEDLKENKYVFCNSYVDGSQRFKEKCAGVPWLQEDHVKIPADISIKSNDACRLNKNGVMENCVCRWSMAESPECFVNKNLAKELETLRSKTLPLGIEWYVTEAFPPTVYHVSNCHYNGNCVDIAIATSQKNCTNIKIFVDKAEQSGFRFRQELSLIEYNLNQIKERDGNPQDCENLITTHPPTATGDNFHLYVP